MLVFAGSRAVWSESFGNNIALSGFTTESPGKFSTQLTETFPDETYSVSKVEYVWDGAGLSRSVQFQSKGEATEAEDDGHQATQGQPGAYAVAPPPKPQPYAPYASVNPSLDAPSVQSSGASSVENNAVALYSSSRFAESIPLFERACTGGSSKACNYLGFIYMKGLGVTTDYSRAETLLMQACKSGNAEACNNLGAIFNEGLGHTKDSSKAVMLFTLACDEGNQEACNNLGLMYYSADGVTQDYNRAASLFSKACLAGSPSGCGDLGICYQRGVGVEKSIIKAIENFDHACQMGNASACKQKKVLDGIEKTSQ